MNQSTYPNQRRVTIHKCDRKKNYSKLDLDANRTAMGKLGYSAYMLYMYFCMNATGFKAFPSRVAICAETSISKNVYYSAFDKLVAEGYIVPKPGTQCLFDFYEDPSLAEGINPETGKSPTPNQESMSPKQVENILNNIENIARGGATAHPTGDENGTSTATTGPRKKTPVH